MLRLEVRNAETPIEKKPSWIKTRALMGPEYTELKALVKAEGLHTVCEEAGCPNIYECWEDREATFLIGGDQCTRRCDFCNIDTGKPAAYDVDEPRRVAESVQTMGLRYATITGVARDDLPDGGAWLYAETVRLVHAALPGIEVELLIPDFDASPSSWPRSSARPPRCSRTTSRRCRGSSAGSGRASATSARWTSSAQARARRAGHQVQPHPRHGRDPRRDLRGAAPTCTPPAASSSRSRSTSGPSPRHHPVERWVKPEEFVELREEAEEIGFAGVMSGPLVRSSYRAGRLYEQAMARPSTPPPSPQTLPQLASGGGIGASGKSFGEGLRGVPNAPDRCSRDSGGPVF